MWCLIGDMFGHEKVGCRYMGTILRPTSLNYAHSMIIGRLIIYTIPLEPSHRAKTMVAGAYFGESDD